MTDFLVLGRDRHCSMQKCSQVHLPSVFLNQNYSVIKKSVCSHCMWTQKLVSSSQSLWDYCTSELLFTHHINIFIWTASVLHPTLQRSTWTYVLLSFNWMNYHCTYFQCNVQLFFWINLCFQILCCFPSTLLQLYPTYTVS
jgi:hypothetical protein